MRWSQLGGVSDEWLPVWGSNGSWNKPAGGRRQLGGVRDGSWPALESRGWGIDNLWLVRG